MEKVVRIVRKEIDVAGIPDDWQGREVLVLDYGGWDQRTYTRRPLAGQYRRGVLELVNDRGIFGTFADYSDDPNDEQERVFYSWGGVVSIKLFDEGGS